MSKISVLTLTRNRTDHLRNLLKGLAQSSRLPDECVVIYMNEPAKPVMETPFECRHYTYTDPNEKLPLPMARNTSAQKATGDILLFLDVDCIPAKEMVGAYEQAIAQAPDSVLMGAVDYLSEASKPLLKQGWTESLLRAHSQPHPKRDASNLPLLSIEENYGLFWSLSFCMQRDLFDQLGGFSECYPSYGAEDTDFAWKARAQNVPLRWVPDALSFHQYHPSPVPPWHNFESIVRNARIFYDRWGQWPMEGWLQVFANEGYLNWTLDGDRLEVLRTPAA